MFKSKFQSIKRRATSPDVSRSLLICSEIKKKGEKTMTQADRDKIIEVLMSQERVLTLLYDKTFPPKQPNSHQIPVFEQHSKLMKSSESARQFSYFNKMPTEGDDENEEQRLERETGLFLRVQSAKQPAAVSRNIDSEVLNLQSGTTLLRTVREGARRPITAKRTRIILQ